VPTTTTLHEIVTGTKYLPNNLHPGRVSAAEDVHATKIVPDRPLSAD
jgi:hypothetical protein